MASTPTLDSNATRVLRYLDDTSGGSSGVIRGGQIMRAYGFDAPTLSTILDDLSRLDLVTVAGPRTPDRIDLAIVSLHPANRRFVRSL